MKNQKISLQFVILAVLTFYGSSIFSNACDVFFEGFGIHLGSIDHFAVSPAKIVPQVFDHIYNDLGIRHFRTSYESTFSPSQNVYEIVCDSNARICSWIEVHEEISKYKNISIMASIWSAPRHMKNTLLNTLPVTQENNFYNFIRNVTAMIKEKFQITIERVSPVNEPENIFATWEHTNLSPQQLCRMVGDFNDSLISVCPENSYFSTSVTFATSPNPSCLETCKVFGTHAYALTIGGNNSLRAHYDLVMHTRPLPSDISIWQTEVCSTYANSANNQMRESLDMGINIANFVGHTCIQRYYFWYSYTLNPSGESLIWGDDNGDLMFPKKYYVYKHFTQAAHGGSKIVNKYDPVSGVTYLTFGDSKVVFVNNLSSSVAANWTGAVRCVPRTFCCTTDLDDWNCLRSNKRTVIPAESVCSCDYFRCTKFH